MATIFDLNGGGSQLKLTVWKYIYVICRLGGPYGEKL